MTALTVEEAPAFPFHRWGFHPAGEYAVMQAEQPVNQAVFGNGRKVWLLTRYEDVRAILKHPAVSADRGRPDFPTMTSSGGRKPGPGEFIFMDAPEHDVLRRMLSREFTARRMEELRPRIQQIVDELIDDLLAGPRPTDLVEAFALPLPSLVICDLLGVPYDDHEFFQGRTQVLARRKSTTEERVQAWGDLKKYLSDLCLEKERDLGDDLISRLLQEQVWPGHLTHEELAGMSVVLLGAGHETTGNMTALGVLALLSHDDQFARLGRQPELVPEAVDELLRYLSIIDNAVRVATTDIEVGGELIKAGDAIVAVLSAANRDDAVFQQPNELDPARPARNHVAFGHGIHVCLGAPLARLELQVAYEGLTRRIPSLRLAVAEDEIRFKSDAAAYGVHELPVTW